MKISIATFDAITKEVFASKFFDFLEADGDMTEAEMDTPSNRQAVWAIAENAETYGIKTIGALLVYLKIHWELGVDCVERMVALRAIAEDAELDEADKIQKMWMIRCALLDVLMDRQKV